MSGPYANLSGRRIISGNIVIPYWGTWTGDVTIAQSDVIPTQVSLVIGNLTLVGSVFRSFTFSGARSARLVGGFGGWRKPLTARAYQNPGGLSLSMILKDAATEVGESVTVANDTTVGTDFVREAASDASRVLKQLCGTLWWMDPSGVTQVAATRPTSTITTDYSIISWSGARGRFTVATEDFAGWVPGRTFSNAVVTQVSTVSLVTIALSNEGTARVEALAA